MLYEVITIDINELKENGIKILEISPPKNFYEINDIYAMLAMVFLGNKQSDKITEEKIEPLDDALYQAQSKGYEYKYLCITNKFAVATVITAYSIHYTKLYETLRGWQL